VRKFLMMVVVLLSVSGCGNQENRVGQNQNNGRNVNVQQTRPGQASVPSDKVEARLESLARGIPQVLDAKCVVIGRTAIVGLTLDPALDRSRVNTIKYSVAETFRKDPAGIDAFVTADVGMSERIRHVREDIANGRPFAGFAQELGDIISRVAPQLPRDIQPMDDNRHLDPDTRQFQDDNL